MNSFQQALDRWRSDVGAPVVAGAVRVDGSLAWHGVSTSGAEPRSPASARSRFPIYSITKSFTAVCALRLSQAKLLNVEDPIGQWIDGLPLPETVTLSHLLRHTSGIRDYGPLPLYHEAVRTRPGSPWTQEEFLEATLGPGLLFEPGTRWSYSNIGYLLLRRLLERATGLTFRSCVEQHITKPLALEDTFVAETPADWTSCIRGYGREIQGDGEFADIRSVYHPGWCAPGVAVSTVDDTTAFYEGLFDGMLLDEAHLSKMLQLIRVPGEHPPSVTPSYGMGIMADPDSPLGADYGHGGGGPGYSVFASIVPRSKIGRLSVAAFCNQSFGINPEQGVRVLFDVATAS